MHSLFEREGVASRRAQLYYALEKIPVHPLRVAVDVGSQVLQLGSKQRQKLLEYKFGEAVHGVILGLQTIQYIPGVNKIRKLVFVSSYSHMLLEIIIFDINRKYKN